MPYSPTTWTNESPAQSPVKYRIIDDTSGQIAASATIAPVTTITAGTPLNSTNLNKIELGIRDAMAQAEAEITTARLAANILSADATGRGKMADGFITLAKLALDLRFQKLYEFTGNGTTSPDWTNIPQTFKHLILIYSGLSARTTSGHVLLSFHVNNDYTSSYYRFSQSFDASGADWDAPTNPHADGLFAGVLPAQAVSALGPGSGIAIFPDYTGTTFYKHCISLAIYAGTYALGMSLGNSYRASTAAITRLTMHVDTYHPRAGSVFSLYGFN